MNRQIFLMFERIQDGVMIVSRDGVLRYANPVAKKALQAAIDQMIKHPQLVRHLDEFRAGHIELPVRFELDTNAKSGDVYDATLLHSPVGTDLVVLLHNVSESELFNASTRNLLQLVNDTCLDQARQCLDLMRVAVVTGGDAEAVATAQSSFDGFAQKLTTLVELAAASHGESVTGDDRISLDSLIKQAFAVVRPRCQTRRLRLKIKPDTTYPIVYGSTQWLGRAIESALSFVVDKTIDGADVNFSVLTHGNFVTLKMASSSHTLPPEQRERVLMPFVRGTAQDVARHRAPDLGLPLAKVILERHGGHIRLTDDDDLSLSIELPIGAPGHAETVSPEQMERYARDLSRLMARRHAEVKV